MIIKSHQSHITKHENRLRSLGETPDNYAFYPYEIADKFEKYRPTPANPRLKAPRAPRDNKQRALDSQHLTAQEKYNHDRAAIIQIEGGRYYSKGRLEEERRAIRS